MTGVLVPREAKERVIVALDCRTLADALALAGRLGHDSVWVKVGLELFCSAGPDVVRELAAMGKRIFLDLKFHDIPNTVAGAVSSAARLPVQMLTIHAAAGRKAMEAAREAASVRDDLGVLAVTRLTSQEAWETDFSDVERAADEAAATGLFGVVCPAAAAPLLRARHGERLARVVPGIRPVGAEANDQIHVATPEKAVADGADWIVIGRPITRAGDPEAALREILSRLVNPGPAGGGFDVPSEGR